MTIRPKYWDEIQAQKKNHAQMALNFCYLCTWRPETDAKLMQYIGGKLMASKGVNKVFILGHLGQDPEVKCFQNGGSVTSISVATSEEWVDKTNGEKQKRVEWHRINLFNRLGEVASTYLKKGSKVFVEGSLHTRKWTDKEGKDNFITEIRGASLQMLDSVKGSQTSEKAYREATGCLDAPPKTQYDEFDGDIPF